jgi:drug/metabolite transporter (DMT)-like permease
MDTFIAVVAALGAACAFGTSSVLMFRAASLAPSQDILQLRLITRLARNPIWTAGVVLQVASYGIQAVALAFGPLVLVQPLAATDLLFALPLLAYIRREPMGRRQLIGAALVAGGVAAFLAISPPTRGIVAPPVRAWLVPAVLVAAVVGTAAAVAMRTKGGTRTTLLAVAGGAAFALVDALSKSFVGLVRRDGLAPTLLRWEPYVLLGIGIIGLVLSQSAFQSGPLSVSLPVIDTLEPTGAVAIGALVLDERVSSSPALLSLQLCGAAAALAGIFILDRSPLVGDTSVRGGVERGVMKPK